MTLSKAQQKVIDEMKNDIDFARSASLYDWIKKHFRLETDEAVERVREHDKKIFGYDYMLKQYNDERNGITLTSCNSRTLYKLQELGLIEIVKDSKGQTYGIDVVKLLNY